MKIMLPLILALCCGWMACKKPTAADGKKNTIPAMTAADSAIVKSIDSFMLVMRDKSFYLPKSEYRINIVSEKDGVLIGKSDTTANAVIVSGVAHLYPDSGAINLTYIFREGKLALFNAKLFDPDANPPHARDLVVYSDGQRIVHTLERFVELAPGEPPQKLRQQPRLPTNLDQDSLFQVINDDWKRIMKEVEKTKPVGKS